MLRYKTMSTYRKTRSRRTLLILNMLLEMIGPITFGRFKRIWRLYPKATERAIGDVSGKFIQHVQVPADAKITDNSF